MKENALLKNLYDKCTQSHCWVYMHPHCKQTSDMRLMIAMSSADARFLVKDATDVQPMVTVLVATVDPR